MWLKMVRWGQRGSSLEVRGVELAVLPEGFFVSRVLEGEEEEVLRHLVLLAGGVLTDRELVALGKVGMAWGKKAAEEVARSFGVLRKYGVKWEPERRVPQGVLN